MVDSSQLILDLPSLCSFHKCLVNESFLANVFPHKLHNRVLFFSSRFLCETCQWAFRDSWVWNSSLQSGQINGASMGNLGSPGGINAWVATSNFGKNCECTLLTCPLKHGRGFLLVISTLITGRHSKHEYFMPTLPFSFNNDSSYLKNSLTWVSYFWASSCPSMIFSGSLCTWFCKSLWKKELQIVENNCFHYRYGPQKRMDFITKVQLWLDS